MGSISLVPAGVMLGFDNGSVGGTEQGWKRKKGLLLLPFSVFQGSRKQISKQVAQQRFIAAAATFVVQQWVSSSQFPRHCAPVTTGNSPQRSESSHSGPFL